MVVSQGEIWWADLGDPVGSAPGWERPVAVIQSDRFNHSRIGTVLCVPLTSNLRLAAVPGNVLLKASETGLDKDSVANTSQTIAVAREQFLGEAGRVGSSALTAIFTALDEVLGR